jgi:maleylpyruvate isomerase
VAHHPLPLPDVLAAVADAHRRLLARLDGLRAGQEAAPSRLPGWTRAHVLAHLARNAESHLRLLEAARRGEVVDQYPGGAAGRAAEIEAGAGGALVELVGDVRASAAALDAAWPRDPDDTTWQAGWRDVGGTERRVDDLPWRRWQEVEVHLVDLDVGAGPSDWPPRFVEQHLARLRPAIPARLPAGSELPDPLPCPPADELAWLYGRMAVPGLPVLGPWS